MANSHKAFRPHPMTLFHLQPKFNFKGEVSYRYITQVSFLKIAFVVFTLQRVKSWREARGNYFGAILDDFSWITPPNEITFIQDFTIDTMQENTSHMLRFLL